MDQTEHSEVMQSRTMSIINIVFGVWLIIAPFILSYDKSVAYWNEVITGVIVVVLGAVHLLAPHMNWSSWVNGLAGIWLILSPFFFGYSAAVAYWNQIIFGILIAIIAYGNVGMLEHRTHHPAH